MADNVDVLDAAAATVAAATKEIAPGVHAPKVHLVDGSGDDLMGDLTASPAANTVGARLKAIADALTTLDGRVDGLEGFTDGIETLLTTISNSLTTIDGRVDGLEGFLDGVETALAALLTGTILAAGEAHIGQVGGTIARPSATFNRPADTNAYAVGDLVANNTTAASVTVMSFTAARLAAGSGSIRRAKVRKSGTSTTNAQFRLHLYAATPGVPANGDNGAWSTAGVADYLGAIDVTVDRAFTDGASGNGIPITGSDINFKLASGTTVFGLLEARAAYTPASGETFAVELEVLQN